MVTGVETAGLVLGVLPLVIEGLKQYQKGIKTLKRSFKYDTSLKRLIRRVTEQKIGLQDNLEKLLIAAGNASGVDVTLGDNYWQNLSTGPSEQAVKKYLGDPKKKIFEELIEEFEAALLEIANSLNVVQRSRKKEAAVTHLTLPDIQRLAISQAVPNKLVTKKICYLIEESTLVELTEELDRLNSSMDKILTNQHELYELKRMQASQIISDERKASSIASLLQKTRTFTDHMFKAFGRAWASSCHPSHDVALFLDLPELSSNGKFNSVVSSFSFRTLLSEPQQAQNPAAWHEATVTVLEDNSTSNITITSPGPVSAPVVSPTNLFEVQNLCFEIRRAQQASQSLGLLLHCGHPFFCNEIVSCNNQNRSNNAWEIVNFEQLLSTQHRILPHQKVRLALKLAASLLQLKTSQWLCSNWWNQAVYVPKRSFSNNTHSVESDDPLILYTFPNPSGQALSEYKPRVMFLELGIALMAVWNEESFTAFAKNTCKIDQVGIYERDGVAREWFDLTSKNMTDRFSKVVDACLSFAAFEYSQGAQSWDDDKLWTTVCARIISPLHEECNTFLHN